MKDAIVFLVMAMGLMTLIVGLACVCVSMFPVDSYSGKVIFTDEEYYQFKQSLLDKSVRAKELKSLSSDYPFVEFEVQVPRDYPYPFGDKHERVDFASAIWVTIFGAALVGMSYFIYITRKEE
jgi:hypothetical protein